MSSENAKQCKTCPIPKLNQLKKKSLHMEVDEEQLRMLEGVVGGFRASRSCASLVAGACVSDCTTPCAEVESF